MNKMLKLITPAVHVALLFSSFSSLSNADTIKLSSYVREPYIGENLPENGYVYEIVARAFELADYNIDVEFLPVARASLHARNGKVDGFMPVKYSEELNEHFIFSDPFPGDEVGFLKKISSSIPYKHNEKVPLGRTLEKLGKYRVGQVRGVAVHPDFDQSTAFKKDFALDDLNNIDKLALSRVDLVVIDKYVAATALVNHRPHLIGELEFMRPPLAKNAFHVGFSRLNPNAESLSKAFNKGLRLLKKRGELDAILARHAVHSPIDKTPNLETLTIGTVNNNDMMVMKNLSTQFEADNPGVKLIWKVLDENTLRRHLLSDLAISEGQFDVMTIGAYEAPIWANKLWLTPLENIPEGYQLDDVLQPVRQALSYAEKLYALPFYAESSMTFYRRDLFEQAGYQMPENPTFDEIEHFAKRIHKPEESLYGICLRGKPGWGENMALITTMVNTFGGRWFDMKWMPELESEAWIKALTTYKRLLQKYGPPNAHKNGFKENLELFSSGRCGMWIDATVAAGMLCNPKLSDVHEHLSFAPAPVAKTPKGANWLWTWALAIPQSSKKQELALDFILWATSQDYIEQVGETEGWVSVPAGTRRSTYDNALYQVEAPFANFVLDAIQSANPVDSTLKPKPYSGIQFVGIHEFPAIGHQVGLLVEKILLGELTVESGLSKSQRLIQKQMQTSGYYDKRTQ